MTNCELSIIIVHYKTPDLLLDCIQSVWSNVGNLNIEVIVVDNDSGDSSEDLIKTHYPQTMWINAGYNSGFARANNKGIRESSGTYILLLNPDSYITKGFLESMLNIYKSENSTRELGLLGCRVISSFDKSLLVGSGIGFPSLSKYKDANPMVIKLFRSYKKNNKKVYEPNKMHFVNHEIDYVSGACVMIEKNKIDKFQLYLDEDFFLYYEDVEWSYRCKQHGLINFFNAEVEVYHVNSASTSKSDRKSKTIMASEWLYFFKTLSPFQFWQMKCWVKMNYIMNKILLKRKGKVEKLKQENEKFKLFQDNIRLLKRDYTRKPSSGDNYFSHVE